MTPPVQIQKGPVLVGLTVSAWQRYLAIFSILSWMSWLSFLREVYNNVTSQLGSSLVSSQCKKTAAISPLKNYASGDPPSQIQCPQSLQYSITLQSFYCLSVENGQIIP